MNSFQNKSENDEIKANSLTNNNSTNKEFIITPEKLKFPEDSSVFKLLVSNKGPQNEKNNELLNSLDKKNANNTLNLWEESKFFRSLFSNNKNFENSAHKYFPPFFEQYNNFNNNNSLEQSNINNLNSNNQIKQLNSRNFYPENNNLSSNLNEFLQIFTRNNSGADDYLRFLNLNSNRKSSMGLNTGGYKKYLESQIIKEEEKEKETISDNLRKKRKI